MRETELERKKGRDGYIGNRDCAREKGRNIEERTELHLKRKKKYFKSNP